MSQIADSHDNVCSCDCPFSHLLASIFPPGHRDRDQTINQILERDYKALCLSGGDDAGGHGSAASGIKEEKPTEEEKGDSLDGEDIEKLLAAAAEER